MNETERIHKMVEAGTITGDEAERLLSVLREIDGAEEQLNASGEAMEDEAQRIVDRAAAPNDAGNASAAIASEPAAKGAAPSAAPAAAATVPSMPAGYFDGRLLGEGPGSASVSGSSTKSMMNSFLPESPSSFIRPPFKNRMFSMPVRDWFQREKTRLYG